MGSLFPQYRSLRERMIPNHLAGPAIFISAIGPIVLEKSSKNPISSVVLYPTPFMGLSHVHSDHHLLDVLQEEKKFFRASTAEVLHGKVILRRVGISRA